MSGSRPPATMDEIYGRIMRGGYIFTPKPFYERSADCVFYFGENLPYNGHWLDSYVTLFRSIENGEIVGIKVKCVRALVDSIEERTGTRPHSVTFGTIIEEAARLSEKDRKERERQQVRESALASALVPEESYS